MQLFVLEFYSHNFAISKIAPHVRPLIESFARQYVQWEFVREGGRWHRVAKKIYGTASKDRSVYRFHVHQFEAFKSHLERHRLSFDNVEQITYGYDEPGKMDLVMKPDWHPRPKQIPALAYLDKGDDPVKFVNLPTGSGKSYIAMQHATNRNVRSVVLARPQYIEKWMKDIEKTYFISEEDESVLFIRGSASLRGLISMGVNKELKASYVLISNKTMQEWIKLYEEIGDGTLQLGYDCRPIDFYQAIGAGFLIKDEVHFDFHMNFKLDCYTHIKESVGLSATLISENDFLQNMYQLVYPLNARYEDLEVRKAVDAIAIVYRFQRPGRIVCNERGRKTYSHSAFEKSVMRYKDVQFNYLKMLGDIVELAFFHKNHKPGQKCLVYVAKIDFAAIVTAYLKRRFPKVDIRRYVENDPYENLMEAEICVTTLFSAGTGHDIPNLASVVLTQAIASQSGNIQGFGRIRDLGEDVDMRFYYLVCEDIPKHIEYHKKKRELLIGRAKSVQFRNYGKPI